MIPWLTCFVVMLALTPSSLSRCVVGGSAKGAAKDAVAVFSGKAVARDLLSVAKEAVKLSPSDLRSIASGKVRFRKKCCSTPIE
jgi:hypothetical protein